MFPIRSQRKGSYKRPRESLQSVLKRETMWFLGGWSNLLFMMYDNLLFHHHILHSIDHFLQYTPFSTLYTPRCYQCYHFVTILLPLLLPLCYHFVTTLLPLCYHFITTLLSLCYHFVTTCYHLLPLCYKCYQCHHLLPFCYHLLSLFLLLFFLPL